MPSKEAHLLAASANLATMRVLLDTQCDQHLPWVVSIAFYRALHIVEAMLVSDPQAPSPHTDDHKKRNHLLKTTTRYNHIWSMYRELYQASLIARYLHDSGSPPMVFTDYLSRSDVEAKVCGHWLRQVETGTCRLMRDNDFLTLRP